MHIRGSSQTRVGKESDYSTLLRPIFRRIEGKFSRAEPREHALGYLQGLLASSEQQNTRKAIVQAKDASSDGKRRLLTTSRWDEDGIRDDVRDFVAERLASPQGILIISEDGFVKKGDHSVGVDRQYCPGERRVENCQLGVFLVYADGLGAAAIIDRELFLPRNWSDARDRRRSAAVPTDVPFRSKDELARSMVERSLDAGVQAGWVVTHLRYGGSHTLRTELERRGMPYVLAVAPEDLPAGPKGHGSSTAPTAPAAPTDGGSAPDATLIPADGETALAWSMTPLDEPTASGFERWLLLRRAGADNGGDQPYICFVPAGTEPSRLARALRCAGEAGRHLRSAREEAGLDRYEGRVWRAWYRHMTLAMAAHAGLVVARTRTAGRRRPVRQAGAAAERPVRACPRPPAEAGGSRSVGPPLKAGTAR
ncbi:IS701 family transposase [Streptomyces sp. NPDC088253]|uniref:IS701 family transposase n=1 Tax=Streptomyces sp. NPDC088253 TaxID=3365846 RepID=UPI00380DC2E0